MKLRGILALAVTLFCVAPSYAQVNPGTSPMSIAKGGTAGATAAAARTSLGLSSLYTVNPVAHQWISSVVAGVPSLSQPVISDISGWGTGVATALGNGVNASGGLATLSGTGTLSSSITAAPGLTSVGTLTGLTVSGTTFGHDIYASRTSTSGYLFLGTSTTNFFGYSGTNYQLGGLGLGGALAIDSAGNLFDITTTTAGLCYLSQVSAVPIWGSCAGGAAVAAVTNSDGTLTISPTTGSVVASLNLAHSNNWTGFHNWNVANGGIALTGTVGSANGGSLFSPYAEHYAISSVVTGASTTSPEFGLAVSVNDTGAGGSPLTTFKVGIGSVMTITSSGSPGWAYTGILNINSGVGNVIGHVFEADLNVNNQSYTDAMMASGIVSFNYEASSGSTGSFYATAAFGAGVGGGVSTTIPVWGHGMVFGTIGYQVFAASTILDQSNDPISYLDTGTHSTAAISLIGTYATGAISVLNAHATAGDVGITLGVGSNGTSDTTSFYMNFLTANGGANAGSIKRADSGGMVRTIYGTTSDERLKKKLGSLDDAIARLKVIEVGKYQGKDYTGSDWTFGYFAQNLAQATAAPWCASVSSDPDFVHHPAGVDYGCMSAFNTAVEQNHEQRIVALEQYKASHP